VPDIPFGASLEAIEHDLSEAYVLTGDDRDALERSADDVRRGRFASDAEVMTLVAGLSPLMAMVGGVVDAAPFCVTGPEGLEVAPGPG
jgi:hypothetical protein